MEMNQQYLDMFIEESKEHLQNCSDLLLDLEKIRVTYPSSMRFSALPIL